MDGGKLRVGVDVGGTFTDLVILDEASGDIQTFKVPSTPTEPSEAVLNAVRRARDEAATKLTRVAQFSHGTTVASNTLLEGQGARTGLLVTEGFRDLLEIQRHKRFQLFDLSYQKIQPLVPRRLVAGITERIDSAGEVLAPLDEASVADAVRRLASEGITALGICFLFSFKNAAHEQRAAEIAREILPDCFITLSSDIFPQYREYERASTTTVNAYLGPRVSTYLELMSQALHEIGVASPLQLMQSNGGVISWADAKRMPCRIVESGPAAGVIAAAHFGALADRRNLIAFDMGGTTAKAGLVEDGEVRQSAGQELGTGINISRLLQGGGYYVGAATVDLAEVGAGGGSIAWLDSGGVLKVGPQSAGADPGPIAYGFGGDQITVTDANLLLGRIPADYFLGGEMQLDIDHARRAMKEKIADVLGISVEEACSAVIEVANANMMKMLRIVSVEKGCDPGDFTLVAFGGSGPVHAVELAGDLGIREVIVPPAPGLLSAQGLLVADIRYDFRQTYVAPVNGGDFAEVESLFEELEDKGRQAMQSYGLPDDKIQILRRADMRYRRQAYEIPVQMPHGKLAGATGSTIVESFHQAHERLYGRRDTAGAVEFVNLCVTVTGSSGRIDYHALPKGKGSADRARKPSRRVHFRDAGAMECGCYDRTKLQNCDRFHGPAIVEAADSTTVVPPDWAVHCDHIGNLIIRREG